MSEERFLAAYHRAQSTREVAQITGERAGTLRMLAYHTGVEWPGDLRKEPFWDEVDVGVLQGLSLTDIAKSTSCTASHIQQYLDESGQRDLQRSNKSKRVQLEQELGQLLNTYLARNIPPLAHQILTHSTIPLEEVLVLAEHPDKTPSELSTLTNRNPTHISRILTTCGVRHRKYTPRPVTRAILYERAQDTEFSAFDIAQILGVEPTAVRSYAKRHELKFKKTQHIPLSLRMQALSVPEFSAEELSEVLEIQETRARKAQDTSYSSRLIQNLQSLFDDPGINTPYVSSAYVQRWLSE